MMRMVENVLGEVDPDNYQFVYDKPFVKPVQRELRRRTVTRDPHSFVTYRELVPQPYTIVISMRALFVLTLHSHLFRTEVIGFIAGNCKNEVITIEMAIPCRSVPTTDDFHNVEMDAVSNFEAQQKLNEMGLLNLGWYHSHPYFKNTPSCIDFESHQMLQNQYVDHPYLGVIISPYVADQLCDLFVFFNQSEVVRLKYELSPSSSINMDEILKLKEMCTNKQKWGEKWKGKMTYRDKLDSALKRVVEENNSSNQVQLEQGILDQVKQLFF